MLLLSGELLQEAGVITEEQAQITDPVLEHGNTVITSYSIHYTKLYDATGLVVFGAGAGGAEAADRLHRAEQVVEHVAPVASYNFV